jgi:hypothetical protein
MTTTKNDNRPTTALLDKAGTPYAAEAGITLKDTPAPLFGVAGSRTAAEHPDFGRHRGCRRARAVRGRLHDAGQDGECVAQRGAEIFDY